MFFKHRAEAGRLLAKALSHYDGQDVVVYALPRGGVVTAAEIAQRLHAPLDLVIARKIGHPRAPEYAIAAIAEDGHMVANDEELEMVDAAWHENEKARQRGEARRRRLMYLGERPPVPVEGKVAILVDDGVATGLTMRVGIVELRHRRPRKLVVATPVLPESTAALIRRDADELVALDVPPNLEFLGAIGAYYEDFSQVEDAEVVALMKKWGPAPGGRPARRRGFAEREVEIRLPDGVALRGALGVPEDATAIVLFAHGSGSSRHSPRNNAVARTLREGAIATLLIDLLTEEEDESYETRFDIGLLSNRLADIVRWLGTEPETRDLAVGLFGASTGAAAALQVAAILGNRVAAVVSRGGRPDLALEALPRVVSPTLLLVGSEDRDVLALNERAYRALRCEKELEVVAGATHLFEEPGTLEKVAELALDWFLSHAPPRLQAR
ncbi:MAG TPA: phosphoribosyltransferase family protein [Candidatus Eisenbacteria bacterium]|nr:phosphoribosyltransferase family protein [Candidatus Eisenbacteria bacterium]